MRWSGDGAQDEGTTRMTAKYRDLTRSRCQGAYLRREFGCIPRIPDQLVRLWISLLPIFDLCTLNARKGSLLHSVMILRVLLQVLTNIARTAESTSSTTTARTARRRIRDVGSSFTWYEEWRLARWRRRGWLDCTLNTDGPIPAHERVSPDRSCILMGLHPGISLAREQASSVSRTAAQDRRGGQRIALQWRAGSSDSARDFSSSVDATLFMSECACWISSTERRGESVCGLPARLRLFVVSLPRNHPSPDKNSTDTTRLIDIQSRKSKCRNRPNAIFLRTLRVPWLRRARTAPRPPPRFSCSELPSPPLCSPLLLQVSRRQSSLVYTTLPHTISSIAQPHALIASFTHPAALAP